MRSKSDDQQRVRDEWLLQLSRQFWMCGNFILNTRFVISKIEAARELSETFFVSVDSSFEESQGFDGVSRAMLASRCFRLYTSYQ